MPGQLRERPLSQTLAAAQVAARAAGVVRLADLTGLMPLGIPVFQAVRPLGRMFSVSQGKGLTPAAARISALLEAVESDCAERLAPEGAAMPLDREHAALWHARPCDPRGVRVDPDAVRHWAIGRDLMSGRAVPIPWDLLSLDFTRPLPRDIEPSSLGLATGNSEAEALAAGVAELLEHDLDCTLEAHGPVHMRRCQLDLDSVDAPVAARLLARLRARGAALRVWSVGQGAGLAAFRCVLSDADWRSPAPPVRGNGCHPDREIALIRAVLEAVQSRATLIAGAREDLHTGDYAQGARRSADLILASLSFGNGPLGWAEVPDHPVSSSAEALDILLAVAERQSPLPVVAYRHRRPHPALCVAHCLGPGLRDAGRGEGQAQPPPVAPIPLAPRAARRPVLFVGPTLAAGDVPAAIEVRAPAVCGDLAALLADPPPAVGLIDGCFEIAPSVWHKELLDLIARGVAVLGGASLGAMRAAELHALGMTGVGAIFEAYRDGRLTRDDAVMVSQAPEALGSRPLTVSLVDAEAAIDALDLPPRARRQLQRIVRTTDFRLRSWEHCLDAYRRRTREAFPADAATLAAHADRKRRDALELVARLGAARPGPSRPRPPLTAHYALLLANALPAQSAVPV